MGFQGVLDLWQSSIMRHVLMCHALVAEVTESLGFEFHYFFTRKFWMAFKALQHAW